MQQFDLQQLEREQAQAAENIKKQVCVTITVFRELLPVLTLLTCCMWQVIIIEDQVYLGHTQHGMQTFMQ